MRESEQQQLVEALRFALAAHGSQTRKGVATPYASHLLQVAGLVLEAGGDAGQAAAALLHDTLEDCEGTRASDLGARFGPDVREIVEACTDTRPGDDPSSKAPWKERKTRHLERLARAPARARLVAACDKLHNLRALVADVRSDGLATFARFHATAEQTCWYYEAASRVVGATLPEANRREFATLLAELSDAVSRAGDPARGSEHPTG